MAVMTRDISRRVSVSIGLVIILFSAVSLSMAQAPDEDAGEVRSIEVDEPGGQILSFRHLSGSTVVSMRGTRIEPQARTRMKIQSRPGFVEIDINRGDIRGLQPARRFGDDYLTYVLWAVSVDGEASNLGEITFNNGQPVSINVTTPLQTFWLMITAEPDFAVNDPSPVVVLYSAGQEVAGQDMASQVPGKQTYYTYYNQYSTAPAAVDMVTPNELQQARKAIELASEAGILAVPTPEGEEPLPGELRIRETLEQGRGYLQQAEEAYQTSRTSPEAIQFARTAANIAENARALAIGAVGGINLRRLERELARVEQDLKDRQQELAELREEFQRKDSEWTAQIRTLEEALEQERLQAGELKLRAEANETHLASLRQELASLQQELLATRASNDQLREDREKICGELRAQLSSLGQLTRQGGDLALTLASDILFDFNSFELRPSARENLAKVAVIRTLLFPGAEVRYEGHTDLVGDADYNQWLSEQRALGVYRYFLDQALGLPMAEESLEIAKEHQQIVGDLLATDNSSQRNRGLREELLIRLGDVVIGKGETAPVENTEQASEPNRRVVLLFPSGDVGQVTSLCEEPPSEASDDRVASTTESR